MIKRNLIASFLFVTACSSNQQKSIVDTQVVIKEADKVEIQTVKTQSSLFFVQEKEFEKRELEKSPVITKLLADADKSVRQGALNVAAATLERAVRIAPREAEVFNRLAGVRYKQKKWELAENLAKKSALLAEGNNALKKKNWLLIASICKQKGDHQGAKYAAAKAKQYR